VRAPRGPAAPNRRPRAGRLQTWLEQEIDWWARQEVHLRGQGRDYLDTSYDRTQTYLDAFVRAYLVLTTGRDSRSCDWPPA
jgi:hypothetical protein